MVAVFLSVIAFVERTPASSPLFVVLLLGYCLTASYVFFVPLAGAHDLMATEKRRILSALNAGFQDTYSRIASCIDQHGIALGDAQKIESLERLHRIAARMPVWPMDTRIVGQFVGIIAAPLVVALAVEAMMRAWSASLARHA